MILRYIALFVGTAVLARCQSPGTTDSNEKLNPGFAYSVNQPAQTFEMPASLKEISGLGMSEDGQLLTLNDEESKIFKINRFSGEVMSETLFDTDGGDFEGIEMVGQTVYAVKSKGKLYAIHNFAHTEKISTETFSCSGLNKAADVEGLAYDPQQKILLLACKGPAENASEREVWSFDLQTKKFSTEPVLKISYAQIRSWLTEHQADMSTFPDFESETALSFHFGSSGFAVHPKTGLYYILSSPGKMLLVCKNDGSIINLLKLDKKVHAQPEGITFSADGTMYICNEGKKESSPKIYRFEEYSK